MNRAGCAGRSAATPDAGTPDAGTLTWERALKLIQNFYATYKHKQNATPAGDVTLSYQWSTDQAEWKSSGQPNTRGTIATITPSAPVSGEVTVTTTITSGASGKIFIRPVATQNPYAAALNDDPSMKPAGAPQPGGFFRFFPQKPSQTRSLQKPTSKAFSPLFR